MQMQTLLIDIDEGDTDHKLAELTATIGEPTMVVESGGITELGHAKLHIYWQLDKAVMGNNLQQLLKLRQQIAKIFGGDSHFKSAHQPIRVAGSIYHKFGKNSVVKIRTYSPVEYSIEELITKVVSTYKHFHEVSNNTKTNNTNKLLPIEEVLTNKVYQGGNGEQTRFNHLSRVIGYWLRRCHDGLISKDRAIEEIHGYNLTNVVPPWSVEKIQQSVNGLWKVHLQKYGEPQKTSFPDSRSLDNDQLPTITSFSLDSLLSDKTALPKDIIPFPYYN